MLFILATFTVGYLLIAFEKAAGINKTATALLTGVLCWTWYALGEHNPDAVAGHLSLQLAAIAEILFFLLGAMTIVELVDAHEGFTGVTRRIRTTQVVRLLWLSSLLTFFLSAVLDNLTTAIVMVSLLRKLVKDNELRKVFAGILIVAANAGGAWSPIGDITTTMLWIGGQVSAANIMATLFLPSLACVLLPLLWFTWKFRGRQLDPVMDDADASSYYDTHRAGANLMLLLGVGVLLFVPVFKLVTHLPPYTGVLLGLGVVWVASEIIHRHKDEEERKLFTAVHALSRIDSASILFFLGILLAVGVLESMGTLHAFAMWMDTAIGNQTAIVTGIGLVSAVIDNVPLVAAAMGMYPLAETGSEAYNYALAHPNLVEHGQFVFNGVMHYLPDARLWEFLAYCSGTGGSILIIGSAAGVAVMGMEDLGFGWYLRRIGLLALLGYFAGVLVYVFIYPYFAVH